jgi:hypothetical protein
MSHLENIHANLETIEEAISRLSNEKRKEINVTDYGDFCLAVGDIVGYSTAYNEMAGVLRINPTILTKFVKFRGTVPTNVARTTAERLRSYVRSLDQKTQTHEPSPPQAERAKPQPEPVKITAAGQNLTFPAEQWALVQLTSETSAKIATICSLLNTIIIQIKRTNALPESQAITDIERQQLIAVLEAALAILKTPLVEKGLLKRAYQGLLGASKKAAEKQVEQGIGNASSVASRLLADLIKGWFS